MSPADGSDVVQLLLEMDIIAGDGWEVLCPFLEVSIPAEPFPYLNKRTDEYAVARHA